MANQPIPTLPVAITLDGSEQLELVQPAGSGGTSKRATSSQIGNTAQIGAVYQGLTSLNVLGTLNPTLDYIAILHSDGNVYRVTPSTLSTVSGNVPTGGTISQFLIKESSTNYDAVWATMTGDLSMNGTSPFTATIATAAVTYAKINQLPALSVLANSSSAQAISTALVGVTNQVLVVNPAGTGLIFGQVNLSAAAAVTGFLSTSFFTGILSVALGGSGTSKLTANGIVAGNGTSSVQIIPADTGGKVLLGQGTATLPAFQTVTGDLSMTSVGSAVIVNNAVTVAKLFQPSALSVVGNSSSALANATSIVGAANQLLVVNTAGTGLAFSPSPTLGTSLTSPLIIGGSGAASTLTLESTSGTGTADSIIFKTGNKITGGQVDTNQNFVWGTGAALTTGSSTGYFYIPTMAGTASGTGTKFTGSIAMVYDTANSKLWVNTTGSTWKGVALA